jgi:hypothetical protein
MAREQRQYTAAHLYGTEGRPRVSDIHQDDLYDCYFLAPMGAIGEQQPDRIRDAIRFNAETGDFTVNLYRPPNEQERSRGQTGPIQESINVSQEDIRRNIRERGGGTVDNNRDRSGALWPTVIEASFAELYGRNAQGEVNLNQGYRTVGHVTGGGGLRDGTYALTGESGRSLQIRTSDTPPMVTTGPDHVERREDPPYRAPLQGSRVSVDSAYTEVQQALAAGKPVSLATQGRDVTDGLEESHAYMVVGVSRNPQNNDALVTLRNPYGTNDRAGEGNQNVGVSRNTSNPEITVSLNTLVRAGSFAEFNIGPAPRVQTQQQEPPVPAQTSPAVPVQPASNQSAPTNPPPAVPQNTTDITQSTHLGHQRFQQALSAIENSPNIPPNNFTGERLLQSAANVAYASLAGEQRQGKDAQNETLSRIDFVVFNKDRSGLIAGEGELGKPNALRAWLPSELDNANSLAGSSQRMHTLLQDPQKLALANPNLQPSVAHNMDEPQQGSPRR